MVQPDARVAESALAPQVFKKRPCASCKRLVRRAGSAAPHEAGHHETEHLLDRIAGLVGDLSARAFGATALPALADPTLDKCIDMDRQLLPGRRAACTGKVPEVP